MKKIINLILVLLPTLVLGQTQTENYIKTVTYKVPTLKAVINPTAVKAAQNTTYYDGSGRPIQQIAGQQSSSGKDIITHIEYDNFGRPVEEYLPFNAETTNMAFDPTAKTKLLFCYASPNLVINGNLSLKATTNPPLRKVFLANAAQ